MKTKLVADAAAGIARAFCEKEVTPANWEDSADE